jgi:hypothetical protein
MAEIAGVVLALPATAHLLVKVSLNGYRVFQDARVVGLELQKQLTGLGVMEQALKD